MYFFSETDPNYRIKGSRDPLGFQSLWAAAGHKAVAHLSTVSANLRDFMILAYATYFYGNRNESYFLNFFLKFEQVCAYARKIYLPAEGFNGIDFVNKRKDDPSFFISLKPSDTLLSNQRAYGIYGKYIRPTRDMGFTRAEEFNSVMEQSLSKTNKLAVLRFVEQLLNNDRTEIVKDELKPMADLLSQLTQPEKELYRNYLLKVPDSNHPQNNLYSLVENNRSIAESEFNLHATVQVLQNQEGISAELNNALENIRNTDRVLLPLNRCFTHLLGQSQWTLKQIEDDSFIQNLPRSINYVFTDSTMQDLNGILSLKSTELIDKIIERNDHVKQGGRAWIKKKDGLYKVIYGESGQIQADIDFENSYEFPYFLNTWLHLYKQIELN